MLRLHSATKPRTSHRQSRCCKIAGRPTRAGLAAQRSAAQVGPPEARVARTQARFPDEVIEAPPPLGVQFMRESDTAVRLVVNVPAMRCDDAYKKVVAELRKDYNVPGFRNNEKVPVDMLVQAAGGERQVKFACLEEVMHSTIQEAFQQCPDDVIEGTVRVESNAEELVDQFQRDADLQYVVSAETGELGVSFSAPYTGMDIEVEGVINKAKEDASVEKALTRFMRDRGGSLQVAQRGCRPGDTLIIDFEVRNSETQEAIPAMTQERHELDCLDEENFLPGVMPQMMGMQVGEQQSFSFQFPDPWEPVELAGVNATVKVKVREVLQWNLPELSLEMCQSLQPHVQSTDEFKRELREAVREQAKQELQDRIQSTILEKLSEITDLDRIPEAPFETFALGRYEGRLHEAMENGVIKQDQLEELTQEHIVKQYITSQRSILEKEFATLMAVDEVYKREKLTIDEKKVAERIELQKEEFKKLGKIATTEQVEQYIRSELQQRAAMEFLQSSSSVKVNEVPDEPDVSDVPEA